ncbi:hypothetical protein [Desertimonas flava]|uniref:hypothetical protein n=1 Tax=Desertimonas flava TaxID=2064846 RepID=UPI000E35587F|nr:hypothetical protein [Desertimonas flava]
MSADYLTACAEAADRQGLSPVCRLLAAGYVPFALEQTGGMMMCIRVAYSDAGKPHWAPEQDVRYAWVTLDDDGDDFMVGWYDEPGDPVHWDVHPLATLPGVLAEWHAG